MLDVLVSAISGWNTDTISGSEKVVPVNVLLVNVTATIPVSSGGYSKVCTDVWKLATNVFPGATLPMSIPATGEALGKATPSMSTLSGTKEVPAGIVSVTTVSVTRYTPLFVMLSVYLIVSPTTAAAKLVLLSPGY
ncbi:hypothetical protein [Paenibacillus sp. Aloe-11]|nr:hypothetical protein WG8_4707 [Paenibacillus sp. Aloe-11]